MLLLNRAHFSTSAALMRRAIGYGCRRVNVVVTLHCEVNEDDSLESIGIGHVRSDGLSRYRPLTGKIRNELEQGLRSCFAEAVDSNVDLVILAHLDSNGRRDRWRNHFRFDPTQRLKGYSYEQAMLQVVLAALNVTAATETRVEFNLTGEMGSTIFAHADKYCDILQRMRAQRSDVRFGFNLNHDGIEGKQTPSPPACKDVQRLIDSCDFLGFSNYRPVSVPPVKQDFEASVAYFLSELRRLDLSMPGNMPLHFSEVGLGGAAAGADDQDPPGVAATPYAGPRYGAVSPWADPELRSLRRKYHAALLEYLDDPTGPQPVTAAFLWSHTSWDPMNERSAANFDREIFAAIRRHNQRAYESMAKTGHEH